MGDGAGAAGYKTVRPTATDSLGNLTVNGAGGDADAALSDNSDASYLSDNAGTGRLVRVTFASVSLSASQRVKRVRQRLRCKRNSAPTSSFVELRTYLESSSASGLVFDTSGSVLSAAIHTETTPWYTSGLGGHEWTPYASSIMAHIGLGGFDGNDVWAYESYLDLDIRDLITFSTPSISGTSTTRPTVSWTPTANVDGDGQKKYRVVIYPSSSYSAPGFSPGVSPGAGGQPWAWDSGTVTSSATSKQVGTDLLFGVTYRAYVQLTMDFNGSNWATGWQNDTGFTISIPGGSTPQPPTPSVTRTVDDANARVLLAAATSLNMLTANQSSLETDTTGWAAGASTSIARSTATASHQTASLQLTRNTSTGTASATTPTGASGIPVLPSTQYTAMASFRAATTGRTCRITITWYNSAGATTGSAAVSSGITDSTGAYTQDQVTATSPAAAAYASILVECLSALATEIHRIDKIGLHPGASTTWTYGGYLDDDAGGLVVDYQQTLGPNLLPSNISDGGDTLGDTTGFHARTAADLLEVDHSVNVLQGISSIRWGPSAAGSILDIGFLSTSPTYDRAPLVAPNQPMVASAWIRTETGSVSITLGLGAHNAAGAVGSLQNGTPLTVTTTWQRITSGVLTPGDGALYGYLSLDNTGDTTTLKLLIDKIQLEVASTPTDWTQGTGDRPDDWTALRASPITGPDLPTSQQAVLHDYEVHRGRGIRMYRAGMQVVEGLSMLSSGLVYVAAYQSTADGNWWLKDVHTPGSNWQGPLVLDTATEEITEDLETVHPLGRDYPLSVSSWLSAGTDGTLQIQTLATADWEQLERLLRRPYALLLQSPAGLSRYIRVRERSWDRQGPFASTRRTVQISYQEESAP